MKRRLINGLAWGMIGVLFLILLQVLRTDPPGTALPPTPEVNTGEMAEWIQQRQQLEKQLQNLEQEQKKAAVAPTSIFILFATDQENIITEAASMMDTLQIPALLGVSEHILAKWESNGVPEYVTQRLNAGWEICLLVEEMPTAQMQQKLSLLHLPTAICAYQTPAIRLNVESAELLQDGIAIWIEDSAQPSDAQDGLWRIASIGNMHTDGILVYEQFRNTGSALVNVIGSYQADQTYMKENLEGLLELIRGDSHLGTVQCLHLDSALYYHQQYKARIDSLLPQWEKERTRLQQELNAVTKKITDASSLLNQ